MIKFQRPPWIFNSNLLKFLVNITFHKYPCIPNPFLVFSYTVCVKWFPTPLATCLKQVGVQMSNTWVNRNIFLIGKILIYDGILDRQSFETTWLSHLSLSLSLVFWGHVYLELAIIEAMAITSFETCYNKTFFWHL